MSAASTNAERRDQQPLGRARAPGGRPEPCRHGEQQHVTDRVRRAHQLREHGGWSESSANGWMTVTTASTAAPVAMMHASSHAVRSRVPCRLRTMCSRPAASRTYEADVEGVGRGREPTQAEDVVLDGPGEICQQPGAEARRDQLPPEASHRTVPGDAHPHQDARGGGDHVVPEAGQRSPEPTPGRRGRRARRAAARPAARAARASVRPPSHPRSGGSRGPPRRSEAQPNGGGSRPSDGGGLMPKRASFGLVLPDVGSAGDCRPPLVPRHPGRAAADRHASRGPCPARRRHRHDGRRAAHAGAGVGLGALLGLRGVHRHPPAAGGRRVQRDRRPAG